MNHQLILKYLFERMNKSGVENDNKTLGKLLYVIQAIIQDSSNTKYISFLKQQAKLFENIFNKNINKMINTTSAEIYKSLTNTNLIKAAEFLNENNNSNSMGNNMENSNQNSKNGPNPLDAFVNKANQKIAKYNNVNENTNEEKKFNFINEYKCKNVIRLPDYALDPGYYNPNYNAIKKRIPCIDFSKSYDSHNTVIPFVQDTCWI